MNKNNKKKTVFSNSSKDPSHKQKRIRSQTMTTNVTRNSENQNFQNLKDQQNNNLNQIHQNEITIRTNPSTILTNNYGGNIGSHQNSFAMKQQNKGSKSPQIQHNESSPFKNIDWYSASKEDLSPLKRQKLLKPQSKVSQELQQANHNINMKAQQIQLQQQLSNSGILTNQMNNSQNQHHIQFLNKQKQQSYLNQLSDHELNQSPTKINTFNQIQNNDVIGFSQLLQQKELQKLIQKQQETQFRDNLLKENINETGSADYYKQKSTQLKNKLNIQIKENEKLSKEIVKLRELNFDHVRNLNEIGAKKAIKDQQVVQLQFLDQNGPIPDKVRENVLAMKNRILYLEQHQSRLINHTQYMEKELKNYKNKANYADNVIQTVQKAGFDNFQQMYQQFTQIKSRFDNQFEEQRILQFNNTLQTELLEKYKNNHLELTEKNNSLAQQMEETQQKYNKLVHQHEMKVKEDKSIIYQLRCKIDHIEDASRNIQQGIQQAYQEKDEYAIKVGDLESQNKYMKTSINNFVQTTEKLNKHIKKGVVLIPSANGITFNFK